MDGGDVQVGDAPDITLVFHHSRLVGFSGCNRFGTGGEGALVFVRSD